MSYSASVILVPASQSALLIEIEKAVQTLIRKNPRSVNPFQWIPTDKLKTYLGLYQPNYEYSEYLQAFWYGCQQANLGSDNRPWNITHLYQLIDGIHAFTQQKDFSRRVSDRSYQTKQNAQSMMEYAQSLHRSYARLLVVRVDFAYFLDSQYLVGIDRVYQHLEIMRYYRDKLALFEHLVGSAWCLEQGESKGYHIHAVYYFKGSQHQNDWYMAKQIGELWGRVTEGLGTYHNCNTPAEKAKHERRGKLGVGMIYRDETVACKNSISAVGYLASPEKEDQYLRMKPKGRRAFARGLMGGVMSG